MSKLAIAAVTNAGSGALGGSAFGPWGAVAGAFAGLASTLLQHRGNAEADASEELKTRESLIRSAVIAAPWVVGTAKVSGVLVNLKDTRYGAGDTIRVDGRDVVIEKECAIRHIAVPLSQGRINGIEAVYVNGVRMPLINSGGIIYPDLGSLRWRDRRLERTADRIGLQPERRDQDSGGNALPDHHRPSESPKRA